MHIFNIVIAVGSSKRWNFWYSGTQNPSKVYLIQECLPYWCPLTDLWGGKFLLSCLIGVKHGKTTQINYYMFFLNYICVLKAITLHLISWDEYFILFWEAAWKRKEVNSAQILWRGNEFLNKVQNIWYQVFWKYRGASWTTT